MPREKEVIDFLRRMKETYEPSPGFHLQVGSMINAVCDPDFPAENVEFILEQAESAYRNHYERRQSMREIQGLGKKVQEETDPAKQKEYFLDYAAKSVEHLNKAAEEIKDNLERVELLSNPPKYKG